MRQTHRQRRVSRETDEGRRERMSLEEEEEEGQKCDQGQAGIQENVRNAQPVFV